MLIIINKKLDNVAYKPQNIKFCNFNNTLW